MSLNCKYFNKKCDLGVIFRGTVQLVIFFDFHCFLRDLADKKLFFVTNGAFQASN
jgi:hypothetical protein